MRRFSSAIKSATNILYNTPLASHPTSTRRILSALVHNEPGVLSKVSGVLAGRGYNIHSLSVCATNLKQVSRMTVVVDGKVDVEQVKRQLEDIVYV